MPRPGRSDRVKPVSFTIMTTLIAALLMAVAAGGSSGHVRVLVTPGLEVIVDGAPVGTSTVEEQGKLVRNVPVGAHRVIVRAADGRQASFIVSVRSGETTEISVSPLGFRKLTTAPATDDVGALRVTTIPADSTLQFSGVTRENHDATEITFDRVPPGKHQLVITYGTRTARADLDVTKGTSVTVEVNAKAATIRTTETKALPRRLRIAEVNDALSRLGLPSHWKSAIRTALPSTVSVLDAATGGNAVRVTLKVPSARVANSLMESLESSTAFSRVAFASQPRREQAGWVVDFVFYFPSPR